MAKHGDIFTIKTPKRSVTSIADRSLRTAPMTNNSITGTNARKCIAPARTDHLAPAFVRPDSDLQR
jgi:hypothetical protein